MCIILETLFRCSIYLGVIIFVDGAVSNPWDPETYPTHAHIGGVLFGFMCTLMTYLLIHSNIGDHFTYDPSVMKRGKRTALIVTGKYGGFKRESIELNGPDSYSRHVAGKWILIIQPDSYIINDLVDLCTLIGHWLIPIFMIFIFSTTACRQSDSRMRAMIVTGSWRRTNSPHQLCLLTKMGCAKHCVFVVILIWYVFL